MRKMPLKCGACVTNCGGWRSMVRCNANDIGHHFKTNKTENSKKESGTNSDMNRPSAVSIPHLDFRQK